MQKLTYSIDINAPRNAVWETMLNPETYQQWTKAFSENSEYEGTWAQGEEIRFIDKNRGGTLAVLEKFEAPKLVVAKHIATITADGVIEKSGPMTENWIGTMEIYKFNETKGKTQLIVEIECHKDFVPMFESSWPQALEDLKKLAE